jgi:uncharacterized protein YwbE
MSDRDLRALAHLIHAIRPTWDPHGIRAQLEQAQHAGYPLGDIAAAAVDAARTASTATPAGIGVRLREGWRTDAAFARPTPVPPPVGELWRDRPEPQPPTDAYLRAKSELFPDPRTTTEVPF